MKGNSIWILFMAWSVQLGFIVAESRETNQSLQKPLDLRMEVPVSVPASERELNARIVNGDDVPARLYPWFAKALRSDGPNSFYWGGCGAMVCFLLFFDNCFYSILNSTFIGRKLIACCTRLGVISKTLHLWI